MNLDSFNPDEEDESSPEYDDYGNEILDRDGNALSKGSIKDPELDKEKEANIAASDKMKDRRHKMSPYIEKFKQTLLAIFHNEPKPADLYTALELIYDWTLDKIESSLTKTYEEASQWMRVANDLIEIDEYSLMEGAEDLMHVSNHSATRNALERQYSNLLRSANGNYAKEAQIFLEIAFALVSIVEDEINENPDDAEDYIELKDTLDRKYGPIYKGLENQLNDLASKDRRYGRSIAR